MPKKVLIVEDYEDTRGFMKLLIESFGYEALTAANGNEAVETAGRETPDLILMDIALPLTDGLAATELIRNFADSSRMPIVAVTSHGYALASEALKAGCNEVVCKPLDFVKLEFLLKKYLENGMES